MQSQKRNVLRARDNWGECTLLQPILLSWRALTRYFLDKLCVFGIFNLTAEFITLDAYPSCPTMHDEIGDTNAHLDSFNIMLSLDTTVLYCCCCCCCRSSLMPCGHRTKESTGCFSTTSGPNPNRTFCVYHTQVHTAA